MNNILYTKTLNHSKLTCPITIKINNKLLHVTHGLHGLLLGLFSLFLFTSHTAVSLDRFIVFLSNTPHDFQQFIIVFHERSLFVQCKEEMKWMTCVVKLFMISMVDYYYTKKKFEIDGRVSESWSHFFQSILYFLKNNFFLLLHHRHMFNVHGLDLKLHFSYYSLLLFTQTNDDRRRTEHKRFYEFLRVISNSLQVRSKTSLIQH